MGKFDGVLLASDFDNTFLDTATPRRTGCEVPPVSEGNKAALRYFMDEGGKFTISTGRAVPAFSAFAPLVPMNAPCVVCNGAALYDYKTQQYIETILLPPETLQRGQAVLDRFPTTALEAYHLDNIIHSVRPNEYTRQHEHVTHVGTVERQSLLEIPLPLGKIMFEEEHSVLEEAKAWMEVQHWATEYEIFFSDRTLLEVTAKGANKGGMIRRLAERLGISMEHVYCAGDESNDLSMLAVAREAFAPENCVEAVRNSGATIVADCTHDTIAAIIEILDKRY